jgi:hypothetical protein
MDRYIVILFWVLVCAVIMLSTPTKCMDEKKKEGFYTYSNYFKNYCPSCSHRTRFSCNKCVNCGVCTTATGQSECVPGQGSGPNFREDCAYWEFGDPYFYYPNSHMYPIIREKSIYPYYRHKRAQQQWAWKPVK